MPHIRERSCSIFPVHLGARRCHSDPLMTDGLANEIQFGFECDARPSEKNRLAGCEIGSVLLGKALAVTQSAGPVAVRVGAKSMPNPGETGAPNAPALAVNLSGSQARPGPARARVEPSSPPSAAVTETR